MRRTLGAVLLTLLLPAQAALAQQDARVGTCEQTAISRLGERLQDAASGASIPGSGSAVAFANSEVQVSYEDLETIARARVGDPVLLCLVKVPQNCPAADARGRWFTATDLRTMESWTLPNAQHSCGGA